MQRKPNFRKVTVVVATCALAGAGAGIAGSMAAPKSKSSAHSSQGATGATGTTGTTGPRRHHPRGPRGMDGPGGFAVHAELVVPQRDGSGFETIVMDSGKLKSADGSTLTITEGTDSQVYKTVDIDVGSSADVRRNHAKATVSDLKAGDYIHVIKDAKGYHVMAESAAFRKAERNRGPRGRFGPPGDGDGPPGFPGGGAPPVPAPQQQ